jgi:hypothetical protein
LGEQLHLAKEKEMNGFLPVCRVVFVVVVGIIVAAVSASGADKQVPIEVAAVRRELAADPLVTGNLALNTEYSIETFSMLRYSAKDGDTPESL